MPDTPVVELVDEEAKIEGLTPDEASQALGGAAKGWEGKKVRRYIRSGELKAQKDGGRWIIKEEQLATFRDYLATKAAAAAAAEAAENAENEAEDAE